ncbi:hypothetical protein [Nocardia seriolae]|uniref:Uncharacterized protein n=1 Tax=Nocardia seriolae TaxID=37332 RepID=A0A0B8NBN0_9NOCA|nr:hypothetical protein [Nocardia seriolae]MTJ60350.1 hypothetical protein [Nocardia seriolae]MTJ74476.1 hypothetical protein [Nocardia seriolae]MTJ84812.1 hypothetical protein [Nocardia seriolae]MTK28801.1 hypothetical protein [Nocardia seriolae]MTK38279.1 hypothetical protein [Nocardia seriolae]
MVTSGYEFLTRSELARLVPELLLCGHLIDRSGMAHVLGALGRPGMTAVAIDEWRLASPVYTRRMRKALGIDGDGVDAIFKCFQLDIGAPPQFMDFRFRVIDHDHGEFHLDHCGALADVEPMGTEFVVAMCHDIEDPTFDATALATNPHARVRPVHRPPREPADRKPVCAWTVTIDPQHEPPAAVEGAELVAGSEAAGTVLSPIDPDDEGLRDYSGPLLSDLRFEDFSRSALIRIADEVSLQHHLLTLGYRAAVEARTESTVAVDILRKQFTGIAGLTSERLRAALGLGDDFAALAKVLRVHPAFNPAAYVDAMVSTETAGGEQSVELRIGRACGAADDGAWAALLDPDHLEPLDALVRGVNPRFYCGVRTVDDCALTIEIRRADLPFRTADEVAITRFSSGAGFAFTDRGTPLPLTVR